MRPSVFRATRRPVRSSLLQSNKWPAAKFNIRPMGWWLLKTFGQLLTIGRELSELEYLWRVPHRISGDKLKAAIGDYSPDFAQ